MDIESNNLEQQSDKGEQFFSETRIQKLNATLNKKKQKRRQKPLKWSPILVKTLEPDESPIFIYNFFRLMKSYDNDSYERFYNYGFQDAGIGILEQIQLDKVNETIDIQMTTYSQGIINFRYLIKMYKSFQNQKYYELALVLKEYQKWADKAQAKLFEMLKWEQFNEALFGLSQLQFQQFQQTAKDWAQIYYEDQLYDLIIGYLDFKTRCPVLKMHIISKNLSLFVGNGFEETYNNISNQKNKDFFSFFVRDCKFDGMYQLEKAIKYLKQTIDYQEDFLIDEDLTTEEGYVIPVKKSMKFIFYNQSTNKVQQEPYQCFIISHSYNVEPHWIKFLLEKRSQTLQSIDQTKIQLSTVKELQNFDYNCQKEYFIEKYYNQEKNVSIQID
ncbi:hypothetical protein ABPG74_009009 [Tetrahymena malaccensis]